MLRNIAFLLLWVMVFFVSCEQIQLKSADQESFILNSARTGQDYEITVLLPPDYDAARTYPSVYLIDGHWHYLPVAADAKRLMGKGDIREIILVGIAYAGLPPNTLGGYQKISDLRIDDLTMQKNEESAERGGKAPEFRAFLAETLIPEVESRYSTSSSERTLMGHSLGGYFGLWEMFTHPDSALFENIEAGSPALWWADGFLMAEEERIHSEDIALPFNLHTTMGELETVVWNTFFDEFEERMNAHQHEGLSFIFERYPKGHSANAEKGFEEGLKYFFGN